MHVFLFFLSYVCTSFFFSFWVHLIPARRVAALFFAVLVRCANLRRWPPKARSGSDTKFEKSSKNGSSLKNNVDAACSGVRNRHRCDFVENVNVNAVSSDRTVNWRGRKMVICQQSYLNYICSKSCYV